MELHTEYHIETDLLSSINHQKSVGESEIDQI